MTSKYEILCRRLRQILLKLSLLNQLCQETAVDKGIDLTYAPANEPSEYWRLNMYLPFMDHLLAELDIRLISAEPRFCAKQLLPTKASQLDEATGDTIKMSKDEFWLELRREYGNRKWANGQGNIPKDLQETLKITNKDFYPWIYIVLCIFACMPVSTATTEHSFSTMRSVKTYLRKSMSTKRLSGLLN